MSSIVQKSPTLTLDGLTAMSRGLRVRPDGSGNLQPAGAAEKAIGTLAINVNVGDTHATVELFVDARYLVASGAIAGFAEYGPAANGKIAAGGTDGMTLQASTADGDMIVCVPFA